MKFSILFLVFLLLLQEANCLNEHIDRLSHFRNKLKKKLSTKPLLIPPPNSDTKKRVVYPGDYGADPSGAQDSTDAMVKAVEDAFAMESGLELLPGIRDLGGVIIDLQGGNYKISKSITFPPGRGNVVVEGGSFRASDTFPGDRHLIELSASSSSPNPQQAAAAPTKNRKLLLASNIQYEDITFRDILFDSTYRGGGLLVVDSARTRIDSCFFLHFTTQGILVQRGLETFITSCFLGQHSTVGDDKGESQFSGTAIDLSSNDNAIIDIAVFSAAVGIVLRGRANILTGVHCYNKATGFGGIGIQVKLPGYSLTRIDTCYMDYTSIVMEDPVQVHVTNGFFLGDANIVLKSIEGQVSGLSIVDNMFSGNPNNKVPIVQLDGDFSSIDQVVADRNSVDGMSLKSTVGKLTVAGNGTKWVGDFSGTLLFPNRINNFQYSFQSQGDPKFVAHSVTSVSNNVVVVESDNPANGVVSFLVEQ